MTENPQVSVVIPAFNAARFIDRTLASATAQTFKSVEIIVVNDGSTDATVSIVQSWLERDPRIRLLSRANGGVARARNTGIAAARGQFIAFLDADDLWHPEKLQLQVDCMTKGASDLAGCYTLTRSIDADDRVTDDRPNYVASGYILARHLGTHLVGNGSCIMVRHEIAVAIGGFDPTYADRGCGGCEDFDFELKLAASYAIGAVPFYLVGYRKYEGNMSSHRSRMAAALNLTVTTHLAANPALPRRVQRWALARTYEYSFWNNLREKHFGVSLVAAARLCRADPSRAVRCFASFSARIARSLRTMVPLASPPARPTAKFHELAMDELSETAELAAAYEVRRLQTELARVDAALLAAGPPRFTSYRNRERGRAKTSC